MCIRDSTYQIVAGNEQGLFSIDPLTGELTVNGWIDFERQPQHVLTIEVNDHFTPNPGVLTRTVVIDLIDETAPDDTEDLDGNGIFDAWESAFGVSAVDPASDDDHDGIPAFFEFLAGGNPNLADPSSLLGLAAEGSDLAWNVRNGFVLGQDYGVERSPTLAGWTALAEGADYQVISVTPIATGISRVVIHAPSASTRSFLRLTDP